MRKKKSTAQKLIRILIVVLLAAAILLAIIETTSFVSTDSGAQELVSRFGYIGILFIAIMAGVNVFVPVPAATFTPIFIAAGLSLPLIVLTLILGTTIADIAGYTIGRLSKEFASEHYPKTYHRIFHVHQKHHRMLLPLIFMYAAFVPFPNEAYIKMSGSSMW